MHYILLSVEVCNTHKYKIYFSDLNDINVYVLLPEKILDILFLWPISITWATYIYL